MPLYPRPIHDRNFEHLNEQIPRTTATGGWGPDLPPVSGHFRNSNLREYIDQMNSQEAARTSEMGRLEELERRLDAALQQDPDPPPVETLLDKLIGYYAEGLGDLWSAYQNAFPTGPLFETNDQPGIHEPRMTPQGEEAVMGLGMQGGISKLGRMLPGKLGDVAGYVGHSPGIREPIETASKRVARSVPVTPEADQLRNLISIRGQGTAETPQDLARIAKVLANSGLKGKKGKYKLGAALQQHGVDLDDFRQMFGDSTALSQYVENAPGILNEIEVYRPLTDAIQRALDLPRRPVVHSPAARPDAWGTEAALSLGRRNPGLRDRMNRENLTFEDVQSAMGANSDVAETLHTDAPGFWKSYLRPAGLTIEDFVVALAKDPTIGHNVRFGGDAARWRVGTGGGANLDDFVAAFKNNPTFREDLETVLFPAPAWDDLGINQNIGRKAEKALEGHTVLDAALPNLEQLGELSNKAADAFPTAGRKLEGVPYDVVEAVGRGVARSAEEVGKRTLPERDPRWYADRVNKAGSPKLKRYTAAGEVNDPEARWQRRLLQLKYADIDPILERLSKTGGAMAPIGRAISTVAPFGAAFGLASAISPRSEGPGWWDTMKDAFQSEEVAPDPELLKLHPPVPPGPGLSDRVIDWAGWNENPVPPGLGLLDRVIDWAGWNENPVPDPIGGVRNPYGGPRQYIQGPLPTKKPKKPKYISPADPRWWSPMR
jgi:tetratricopeptide (TPR) repeat protein